MAPLEPMQEVEADAASADLIRSRTHCMLWLNSGVDSVALRLPAIPPSMIRRRGRSVDMLYIRIGNALAILPHVFNDALTNDAPEVNRHRVADHSAQRFEMNRLAVGNEGVARRKALEQSALAEGDTARLRRVPEAPVTKAVELSSKGWRRRIVLHAAVDAGVRLAGLFLVARSHEVLGPVAPSAARRRVLDALVI